MKGRTFLARGRERGATLFVVVLLAMAAVVLVGTFLTTSLGKVRHVELQAAENDAFNAAESGLNALIDNVWRIYRSAPPSTRFSVVDALDGKNDPAEQLVLSGVQIGRSTYEAVVREVRVQGSVYADAELAVTAENPLASKRLTAFVRFDRKPSQVFNHAYFINNFGWLWGSGITVNGSVRSNGNFSLRGAKVNGDIVAAVNDEISAAGTIEGDSLHDSVDAYNGSGDTRIRPTDPSAPSEDANGNGVLDPGEDANGNGELDLYDYAAGYDGESERHEGEASLDMPYLGDLSTYRDLALSRGGEISVGGQIIVAGVQGDAASEESSVILVGTPEDPIVIDGPVVVEGDVVLKGVITGRGTIYAGRNVHIIGNLTYLNPPEWPKPLSDPEAAKAANASKDLVGLAAKGSILMGDYTEDSWKSGVESYVKPPFTQAYEVDPTDGANGYVSYTDGEGRPMFDGNYTAYDGGTKKDVDGNDAGSRRFYESSFSDDIIHANADDDAVTQVDAVLYTNHLLSGRVGACTWNGSLVSRDEAILYSGSATMNYDVRLHGDSYESVDIFLPREPDHRVLFWREGGTEEAPVEP